MHLDEIYDFLHRPLPNPPSTPTTPGAPSINNSTTSNSASKPVPKDMEDFCELCQKHFCNKYYLKKHKQDVHGIASVVILTQA
jgi:hypothetical protein